MADCNTGQHRIAAILPKDGKLIHKTGSGFSSSDGRQDRNDVGIILLPDGSDCRTMFDAHPGGFIST